MPLAAGRHLNIGPSYKPPMLVNVRVEVWNSSTCNLKSRHQARQRMLRCSCIPLPLRYGYIRYCSPSDLPDVNGPRTRHASFPRRCRPQSMLDPLPIPTGKGPFAMVFKRYRLTPWATEPQLAVRRDEDTCKIVGGGSSIRAMGRRVRERVQRTL